jgi:hypothetical protein
VESSAALRRGALAEANAEQCGEGEADPAPGTGGAGIEEQARHAAAGKDGEQVKPVIEQGNGPMARKMQESLKREREQAAKDGAAISQRMRSQFEAKRLGISAAIPSAAEFGELDFLERDELKAVRDSLVHDYEELSFLDDFQVRVLWKAAGGKSGGHATLGRTKVTSGLVKYFGIADWVIWLAADHCRALEFSDLQVEALLYHELLHCELVGEKDPKPAAKGHDFELFGEELRRYGFWSNSAQVAKSAVQLRLALESAPVGGLS